MCATITFSVSLRPAVEALNIFCLGSLSPSLVGLPLLACPASLASHLVTLIALAFVCVFLLVQSSDVHRLRRVHQCRSRKHNVADLFADRCVRVESSGVHHEVVQDVCVFDSSLHDCHFQRLRKWCSCDGFVLLDKEIKSVKWTARVDSEGELSGSCSFTNHIHPAAPSVSLARSSVLKAPNSQHMTKCRHLGCAILLVCWSLTCQRKDLTFSSLSRNSKKKSLMQHVVWCGTSCAHDISHGLLQREHKWSILTCMLGDGTRDYTQHVSPAATLTHVAFLNVKKTWHAVAIFGEITRKLALRCS